MRTFFLTLLFACIGVFSSNKLIAQRTLHQSLYWTRLYLRFPAQPQWSLHWELDNRRFFTPKGGQNQFISHLHLHRLLGKRQQWDVMSAICYSRIDTQDPTVTAALSQELRLWQAVVFQQHIQQLRINHRLRWDERWFGYLDAGPDRFAFRLRYASMLQYPLNTHWTIKTGDEIMVQWGAGIQQPFDQNRLWGSLEYTFPTINTTVEAQYIWLFRQNTRGDTFFDQDVIRLTIGHTFKRAGQKS